MSKFKEYVMENKRKCVIAAGIIVLFMIAVVVHLIRTGVEKHRLSAASAQNHVREIIEEIKEDDDKSYKFRMEYEVKLDGPLLEDGSMTTLSFSGKNMYVYVNGGSLAIKFLGDHIISYSEDSREVKNYTCYITPQEEGVIKCTRMYNVDSKDVYRTWDWDMSQCTKRNITDLMNQFAVLSWEKQEEYKKNVDFWTVEAKIPNFLQSFSEFDFLAGFDSLKLKLFIRQTDNKLCEVSIAPMERQITYCNQQCNVTAFKMRFVLVDEERPFDMTEDLSGVNLGLDTE